MKKVNEEVIALDENEDIDDYSKMSFSFGAKTPCPGATLTLMVPANAGQILMVQRMWGEMLNSKVGLEKNSTNVEDFIVEHLQEWDGVVLDGQPALFSNDNIRKFTRRHGEIAIYVFEQLAAAYSMKREQLAGAVDVAKK